MKELFDFEPRLVEISAAKKGNKQVIGAHDNRK